MFRASFDPSGHGEGELYLGSVNPDPFGNWSLVVPGLAPGDFVTALLASAEQVGWLRDRGALVEWDAFHLALLPGSGASVLVLNHYGDYVELSPRPYVVPRAPLMAWFRARLEGRRYEFVFDRAERLFLARQD